MSGDLSFYIEMSWLRLSGSPKEKKDREFQVVIYENDYKELCAWVLRKPHIETGGDLFGLWADKYSAVIQLVLGPGKECRRTTTSFYQNVNYLERVGKHLTQNEGVCHIGEWHSHHQLGLARPSGGDENTVWNNMPTYNLSRFVIFIANIGHSQQSYSVNVGCFLFEIDSNGSELPVLRGRFKILHQESPFSLKLEKIKRGEEEKKGDEFDVDIKDLTLTPQKEGMKSPAVTMNHPVKKRTHTRRSEPQNKTDRTGSPVNKIAKTETQYAPPVTSQSQTGTQGDLEASSNTEKNEVGDPKVNLKTEEEQQEKQEEIRKENKKKEERERKELPLQHQQDGQKDSKTSEYLGDGESNQEDPDTNNRKGAGQTDEDTGIKETDVEMNVEEQKNLQAAGIEDKASQVQQSKEKQESSLVVNDVEQNTGRKSNQSELHEENSQNTNQQIQQKEKGRQIEGGSLGTNADQAKAKPLAKETAPGKDSPVVAKHQPGEQEDSEDLENKQGDTTTSEKEGAGQNEETKGMKPKEREEEMQEDNKEEEEEGPKTNEKEGGAQNRRIKGVEEEEKKQESSHVTNGSSVPDPALTERQATLDTKQEAANDTEGQAKSLGNNEKQSAEIKKQENDRKRSRENLGNKETLPKNTRESAEHQKSLDAKKGSVADQGTKGKSACATDSTLTKNTEAKRKTRQGGTPGQTPSFKGNKQEKQSSSKSVMPGKGNPPKQKADVKRPGGARKAN